MASSSSLLEQSRKSLLTPLNHSSSPQQSGSYQFVTLKSSSPHFEKIEKILRENLEPLYGNQDVSIDKIKSREDRKSELLLYNDTPVGLIVYKKEKQDEFSKYGIKDSFELKTFLVIDQDRNAEKGYDTLLLNRVLKLAGRKFATSVHLTASEQYDAEFFSSKGFSIARTWKDKYVQGVTEHLLYLNLPKRKSGLIKTKESSPEAVEEGKTKSSKKKRNRSSSPEAASEEQSSERSKKLRKERKQEKRQESEGHHPSAREKEDAPFQNRDDHRKYDYHHRDHQYRDHRRGYDYYQDDRKYRGNHRDSHSSSIRESNFDSRRPTVNRPFSNRSTRRNSHEITLRKKYIHQIKSGGKTIEGRINNGMILRFNPGDEVRFFYKQNPHDDVRCNIDNIKKYSSFQQMLEQEGYKNCLTDVRSLEEAVRIYDQIPGYAARAARFGVVAIHLSIIR